MLHFSKDEDSVKGWFAGPWNADVPIAVGYANAGVDEPHYHAEMYEVYLVAQGRSTAAVDGQVRYRSVGLGAPSLRMGAVSTTAG